MKLTVGLFNESFPPIIDGVANAVINYAGIIQEKHGNSVVITPKHPKANDNFPFEVFRYDSIPVNKRSGMRAGNPFIVKNLDELCKKNFDILHVHSPFISSILAKFMIQRSKLPIITTYHTKFDTDLDEWIGFKLGRKIVKDFIVTNVAISDEVWAVSNCAAENLRSLGFVGDIRIMENGADFSKGRKPENQVSELKDKLKLPSGVPIFLFVGRLMWYKNIKITLDALSILHKRGLDFRMLFVGTGANKEEIEKYTREKQLTEKVLFLGQVTDRDTLKLHYCLADLFIFPSTFDTNGLVVREAAACSVPSILVKGSGAAEGVTDGVTGFLCEENSESCAETIQSAISDTEKLNEIGTTAAEKIYISWDTAVAKAYARYEEIVKSWPYPLPNQNT